MESFELEVTTANAIRAFYNGYFGYSQAGNIAAKLVEGERNIKVVTRLLQEIHISGRRLKIDWEPGFDPYDKLVN